jgi:hypothetical protein
MSPGFKSLGASKEEVTGDLPVTTESRSGE